MICHFLHDFRRAHAETVWVQTVGVEIREAEGLWGLFNCHSDPNVVGMLDLKIKLPPIWIVVDYIINYKSISVVLVQSITEVGTGVSY